VQKGAQVNKPEPFKVFYVTGNTSLNYKFRGFDAAFLPVPNFSEDAFQWHYREKAGANWVKTSASWDGITGFEYTGEVAGG
jgi:hypothetical protein